MYLRGFAVLAFSVINGFLAFVTSGAGRAIDGSGAIGLITVNEGK